MLPTHGLFSGGVVIVEFAAEQVEPLPQVEDAVIHVVTGAGLDKKGALVGQILGQTAGNHAASRAASDNDIVVAVDLGRWQLVSGGHVEVQTEDKSSGEVKGVERERTKKRRKRRSEGEGEEKRTGGRGKGR